MPPITPYDLATLRHALHEADALCRQVRKLLTAGLAVFDGGGEGERSTPVEDGVKAGLTFLAGAPPDRPGPVTREDWIAAHRSGRPSPLEADDELRTFVEARLGKMTFAEIVAEVAASFPAGRRISVSGLSRYWRRTRGITTTKRRRRN